jgi:hypothetical protein
MTLLEHIKKLNAESKQWMKDNPGSWAGMVTEDIKYWNDQGIFTVEDYERDNLITSVYEMHKEAYGVKGRHYNFKSMTIEQLEKELNHLCEVAKDVREAEEKAEAKAFDDFMKRIEETKTFGDCKTQADAIRWILQAEGLEDEKDTGYICYALGLNYDKEYLFKLKH